MAATSKHQRKIKIGSVWVNNNPYQGEGEIIVGLDVKNMPGYIECIWANCEKYPTLNGHVEYKREDDILEYYHEVG